MREQIAIWDDVAARFVAARAGAMPLAAYPGPRPATLDDAYAVQASAIRQRGGAIGGWKVGRIAEPAAAALGANRLVGPVFTDRIRHASNGGATRMAVIAGGFAAAEAEFLLRLGDLPADARETWTMADARAAVDRVAVGIEIASSPLAAINDLGPAVTASDFGNNNGLLIGPDLPVDRWDDIVDMPVRLEIDGAEAGAATAATMLDGPWGAVRFVLELAGRRGLPLAAGQWISTGAVTGVHRVAPGDRVRACFGPALMVEAEIAAQHPSPENADGHA